jgi:hypothetical protein
MTSVILSLTSEEILGDEKQMGICYTASIPIIIVSC